MLPLQTFSWFDLIWSKDQSDQTFSGSKIMHKVEEKTERKNKHCCKNVDFMVVGSMKENRAWSEIIFYSSTIITHTHAGWDKTVFNCYAETTSADFSRQYKGKHT